MEAVEVLKWVVTIGLASLFVATTALCITVLGLILDMRRRDNKSEKSFREMLRRG